MKLRLFLIHLDINSYKSILNNLGIIFFGKKKTEEFIRRNPSFEISDNDFIEITQQACLLGLECIDNFYVEITKFALEVYPDFH